jgi:hypothetical protein
VLPNYHWFIGVCVVAATFARYATSSPIVPVNPNPAFELFLPVAVSGVNWPFGVLGYNNLPLTGTLAS